MAGNPSTAFAEEELYPDPTYDPIEGLPDWLKRRIARQQKLAQAFKWYNDLHWGWKLGVGVALLIGAITLTALSGGGWLGTLGVVAQVAIGVGIGVGLYSLGAAFVFHEFSLEGLGNAALDSFLASSAIVFISSSVSFIKHLSRSKPVSTAELKGENIVGAQHNQLKPTQDYVYKNKVAEYIKRLSNGEKLDPLIVAQTDKGKFILDGHHRYVASKLTNIKVDIIIQQSGPVGFPDWTFVNWL